MTHEREAEAPKRLKCPHKNCGHEWEPRKKRPVKCPRCQNPLWTSPNPKTRKPPTARAAEAEPTPTAPSEAQAPTPPTYDMSSVEFRHDVAGAEPKPEPEPETPIQRARREADERLRRLADAPVD